MAKKTNNTEEFELDEPAEVRAPSTSTSPSRPAVPVRRPKPVSFEVWAQRKGAKPHHLRGLRAFVKNPGQSRSMEAWDKVFASY